MLPPDTSSTVFPWRVVVPMMQLYGCFPFIVSATSEPPTFSLPLCLWSIFTLLLRIAMFCNSLNLYLLQYFSLEVGAIAHASTIILLRVVLCFLPVAMGVRCGKMAELLHNLSKITEVSPPPTCRWYCKPQTLLVMFLGIMFTIFSVYIAIQMGVIYIMEAMMIILMAIITVLDIILPNVVPSMVFGLLGRRLVTATEATVATVSKLLAPAGSFKTERDAEAAMLALRDLYAVITEVELQREAGTSCFFPVVTTGLLIAVLVAIACPYAILKGKLMGGTMIILLFIAYYVMASYCHMGQTFVKKTSAAEGLLRDLTVKSNVLSFNLKMNQLMGRLSRNLSFDMCGWYKLEYSSFLGLINTVLTYLVIIFQVGGTTLDSTYSSSSSPSNSSALA